VATQAGVDWVTCQVLDPACGGAAFLAPVALRIAAELDTSDPAALLSAIGRRLRGYEIDPFAAWLSQTLVEAALMEHCRRAGRRLPKIAVVCDSLSEESQCSSSFDLVIGNPPYGRIRLSGAMRRRFARSLYGHANFYGLFTDAAVSWVRAGGVIAFVTPTSMLGREYYKNLRHLLGEEAPPFNVDFVTARSGVFTDVLQETMLAVYRRDGVRREAAVSFIEMGAGGLGRPAPAGKFTLPDDPSFPWLLPRSPDQWALADRLRQMPTRLFHYRYRVSTGPLVWNRHKRQFSSARGRHAYPVVWAESVTSRATFTWRSEKKNHLPWFKPSQRDLWVVTDRPCVLVQRTTAKEQARRLIAAELPESFIAKYRAVVVENHLNMVWVTAPKPAIPPRLIAALLNSEIVDSAFRCINGSVAVSAYELEALPLPSLEEAAALETLLENRVSQQEFDEAVKKIYMGMTHVAAGAA